MFTARTFILLFAALLLGLFAVLIARHWVSTLEQPGPQAQTVPVVVAALEIPYLQKVDAAHVKTVAWPKDTVPDGAFSEPAQVLGKIVTQTMYPDEAILQPRLRDPEGGSPLAMVIAPNMRAVAVRVNDVTGVGGFLLPGNRVDVLASKKSQESVKTETIVQDVKVLAVDQEAAEDKEKPVVVRAVTLEMSPAQTEAVVKASEEGSLQLALRNPTDKYVWVREPPTEAPYQPAVREIRRPQAPAVHPITLIKGTAAVTVKCTRSQCSEAN